MQKASQACIDRDSKGKQSLFAAQPIAQLQSIVVFNKVGDFAAQTVLIY